MKRIIVGITGATGARVGIRLLEKISLVAEVHLVISDAALRVIGSETSEAVDRLLRLAAHTYKNNEIYAPIASGTFITSGMVIAPCSIKTLSGVANSYADTLMVRAADVSLKQRRPLILGVRETPLHLGHLRLMTAAAEYGAIIMPFMPAFYGKPAGIDDLVDHWVGQVFDLLGLEHDNPSRYAGPC
jgi:flavin prenyltransferase